VIFWSIISAGETLIVYFAEDIMVDWSKAKEGIVTEVLKDSETYLAGTVTIAASADQRAAVVAGTFATAGAAIVAGVIGFVAAASQDNAYALPIYAGGLIAALLFISGAIFCIRAAMPVGFYLPGTRPSGWGADVVDGRSLQECQHDLIDIRESAITANIEIIKRNAKNYKLGAYLGISAPVAGALVWLLIVVLRHCRLI
jgi:hypothetical protein